MIDSLSPTICPGGRLSHRSTSVPFWNDAQGLLRELLESSLVRRHDWEEIDEPKRRELLDETVPARLLQGLMAYKLLTEHQVQRIQTGQQFGLVLGNYRVLEPLGRGAMGQVYKAEHLRLPRQVAIKVQTTSDDVSADVRRRFENEAWAIGQLNHRNIVAAIDAGEVASANPAEGRLNYFVMEFVPGVNLEEYVRAHGAMQQEIACSLIFQAASALQETNKHNLVHRDIKPSNIIVTPDGLAKLLDFGLSRQYDSNMTNPGAWLGTIDYLSPEQAQDASSVDIRADIYSLGATFYWCLTGRTPFISKGRVVEDFLRRLSQPPPSVLDVRSDLAAELDTIVGRMMAIQPGDRYQSPAEIMTALAPFVDARRRGRTTVATQETTKDAPVRDLRRKPRVLVADDEATVRKCVKLSLISEGIECDEAANGEAALALLNEHVYDLVLTDIEMPTLSGLELLKVIRNRMGLGNLKVFVFSGRSSPNEMARMMSAGADDYLVKPLSIVQLRSRVNAALRLKQSQDAAVALNQRLFEQHQDMVASLSSLGGTIAKNRL